MSSTPTHPETESTFLERKWRELAASAENVAEIANRRLCLSVDHVSGEWLMELRKVRCHDITKVGKGLRFLKMEESNSGPVPNIIIRFDARQATSYGSLWPALAEVIAQAVHKSPVLNVLAESWRRHSRNGANGGRPKGGFRRKS